MKEIQRPLDFLNEKKDKPVIAKLNTGFEISGILLAFDIHINIVLDNSSIVDNAGKVKKVGRQFIRGDSISFIY